MKICSECSIEKSVDSFNPKQSKCKDCQKEYIKQYHIKNKEELKIYQQQYNTDNKDKRKQYRAGRKEQINKENKQYYLKNKESLNDKQKKYNTDNKELLKEYKKQYYVENKNEIKEKAKIYSINNKEHIRYIKNKYKKNKRRTDHIFKLQGNVSRAISRALRRNGSSKNGLSILNYLPYTLEQLKQYLESLFEPWMNWDNWGIFDLKTWDDNDQSTWTWQIDHIIPHSRFKYSSMEDDEFKKCWALNNLRPYSAKQNNFDNNRRTI